MLFNYMLSKTQLFSDDCFTYRKYIMTEIKNACHLAILSGINTEIELVDLFT